MDPVTGVATVEAVGIARSRNLVPNTIIFWRPTKPFVCLGYFQLVKEEVYADVCEKLGVSIVRRILGGGTGYVDKNQLLYDIVIGTDHPIAPISSIIQRMYNYALRGVLQGLRDLGFNDVTLVSDYNNAIWINGKKVSGNSSTGLTGAQIVGGSLLVDFDFETMSKVFRNPFKNLKPGINSIEEGLTCINRELSRRIELSEVKKTIKSGFEKVLNTEIKYETLTRKETELIKSLEPKFASKEWTYNMDIKTDKLMPYDNVDGA